MKIAPGITKLMFSLLMLVSLAACAEDKQAVKPLVVSEITEGVHFVKVPQPTKVGTDPSKVEVVEMFWSGCPHCYHMEPYLKKWKASGMPANVEFIKLPSVLNPAWALHAKGLFAAEALGQGPQFTDALFNALHEQGRRILDEDGLVRFAEAQGMDAAKFTEALSSAAVDVKVKEVQALGEAYGLTGVPALIVAGKHRVNSASVNSFEEMFQIVDHLVAMESGAAK